MLQVTVWMNHPSFHQSDLFRVLSASGEVDLKVVFAKPLTPDRRETGWQDGLTGFDFRIINRSIPEALRLAWSQRNRVHIVNGLWGEPSFAAALMMLVLTRSTYVIYSEVPDRLKSPAPDPSLARRSIFKEFLKTPFGRLVAPRAAGVLSVSHFAAEFFRGLGVREQAIYPFGYFRSKPRLADHSMCKDRQKIEVVFAGRLIRLKGIDLLLDAMRPLFDEYADLTMTLIGGGELLVPLQEQVRAIGLAERVGFQGVIASGDIQARLAEADLVVLPSRGDGWGLVVNEAFSVGVPVIVSDRCGASDIVQNGSNGYVFRSEDAADLRRCLSDFLCRKTEWSRFRGNAAATGEKVSVEAVGPYLIDCLKHMTGALQERPSPPWVIQNSSLPAHTFHT